MSTYIQWDIFAKHDNGKLLSEETATDIIDALNEYVTYWHIDTPNGDYLCAFLSTCNGDYDSITQLIADYAHNEPNIIFRLECHNEDEDLYQHIYFHGDDQEVLNGSVQYEDPKRIKYDDPAPAVQPMGDAQHSMTYTVGMRVYANDSSDYAGLYGTITEIRTGDDRETENDTPDIYCRFDAPVLPVEIKSIEERFSVLYQKQMSLDEIALDMVIMAPEMLCPSIDPHTTTPSSTVWAVIEDWAVDAEPGHNEALYETERDALAIFHRQLACEAEEGCVSRWNGNDALQIESDDSLYECWLAGEYIDNHYKISVEKKLIMLSNESNEEA